MHEMRRDGRAGQDADTGDAMSVLSDPPMEIAERLGLVAVLPGPDELLLDIDDAEGLSRMEAALACLAINGEEVVEVKRTVSAGGNTHVYLRLPRWGELDPVRRIALQACCGSDPIRELLSLLRVVRNYNVPPTVLFERPTGA